ncbi:MAG: hypothetical protein ACOYU3_10200 [Bacillota bacterium]
MDVYQELIDQIKGKTVNHIVAGNDSDGFDIVFTDKSALELHMVNDTLAWAYVEDVSVFEAEIENELEEDK